MKLHFARPRTFKERHSGRKIDTKNIIRPPCKEFKYVIVGVLDQGILNQLVNLYCVFPILDGDAKRHKAYTGSGNRCPTSSLRDRSCIPYTEVLVVGGYKLGERES